MAYEDLKTKLEHVKHEQAKLAGQEQELLRQKEDLIKQLQQFNLTPDTVGAYLSNLKLDLDNSAIDINNILKELNSNV